MHIFLILKQGITLKNINYKRNKKIFFYLCPCFILLFSFVYYPFIKNVLYIFFKVDANGDIKKFAFYDNIRYLLSNNDFRDAFLHTVKLTALNVPLTFMITLFLALLSDRKRAFAPVYETLFSLPMTVSISATSLIFKSLLSTSVGFVNYFFKIDYMWFESRKTVLSAILLIIIWSGIGFDYLLFLTALRNIKKSIRDSLEIDSPSFLLSALSVKIPLISPTLFYVACNNMILSMMTSAPVLIVIGSSSNSSSASTIVSSMYKSAFMNYDYSMAGLYAFFAFLSVFFMTFLFFLFEKKVFYR